MPIHGAAGITHAKGLQWPVLADGGGAGRIPLLRRGPYPRLRRRTRAPQQSPPQRGPCFPGVHQPCGGVKATGAPRFLKVLARALWSPPQKWKPREPRHHPPRALLAHLIEGRRARGRAEGSPAEKSPSACGRRLHDGAGSDWVRLPRARAGPGGSERGHPTVAEQTGPLSLCMGGRSHVPTDGYLDQSQLQADLA